MVKKKTKKKNKKKVDLYKIFHGFTLVELLAVIVVLGIIMIIAIPSVLNTLETSKRKTFLEYVQKIYSTTHAKWLQETSMDGGVYEGEGMYVYNIRTDLDLSSTGSFGGYVLINSHESDGEIKDDFYMYIWDDTFFIGFAPTFEGIPKSDDVKVKEGAYFHPWNEVGKGYILNRTEVQDTYFQGLDFDKFNDKYVTCFIQEYWAPWEGEEEGNTDTIYFVDGYGIQTRRADYTTGDDRTNKLISCIQAGV